MNHFTSRLNALIAATTTTFFMASIVQLVTFKTSPPMMDGKLLSFGASYAYVLVLAFIIVMPHLFSLVTLWSETQNQFKLVTILTIAYLLIASALSTYVLPLIPPMLPTLCLPSYGRCPSAELIFAAILLATSIAILASYRAFQIRSHLRGHDERHG